MGKEIDHNSRKNKVLAAAVSAYIATGVPVSSKELSEMFSLSSATLRNILSELEREGYLSHPHTSAGRIPTDKGYRYYVDFLMHQNKLAQDQKDIILNEYGRMRNSLEDILEKTTEMASELTNYTAVLSYSEFDRVYYKGLSKIFDHPEFRDYQKLAMVVRMLEEKHNQIIDLINHEPEGDLRIYIGEEIHCPVSDISVVVASYHSGKKRPGKLAVIGPRRMSYQNAASTLESMSDILTRVLEGY